MKQIPTLTISIIMLLNCLVHSSSQYDTMGQYALDSMDIRSNLNYSCKVCTLSSILFVKNKSNIEKAKDLNTIGYRLFLKKEYGNAYNYFECAILLDNTYAIAYHNLSCLLLKYVKVFMDKDSIIRSNDNAAIGQASYYILKELENSPNRLTNVQNDSDLYEFRKTKLYKVLSEKPDLQNDSIIQSIITGIEWVNNTYSGTCKGALIFKKDYSGIYHGYMSCDYGSRKNFIYTIRNQIIHIKYDNPNNKTDEFRLIFDSAGLHISGEHPYSFDAFDDGDI